MPCPRAVNRGPSSHAASRPRWRVFLVSMLFLPKQEERVPIPVCQPGGNLWQSFISPLLVSTLLSGGVSCCQFKIMLLSVSAVRVQDS